MSGRAAAPRQHRTPWDADPLSWLAVPNLPLGAIGVTLVYGAIVMLVGGQSGTPLLMQGVALLLATLGLLSLFFSTRPRRGPLSGGRAAVAVALVSAGMLISAAAHRGNDEIVLELWWAPFVCTLLLLAMAPYSDPPCVLLSGLVLLITALGAAALLDAGAASAWPPLAATSMIVSPVVFGTAGAVAFIVTVTRRLTRWSERPWSEGPAAAVHDAGGDPDGTELLIAQVDEQTSAQLAEALALLAGVVERGEIDDRDQGRAAEVATRLREQLLASANDSWLERMARGRPLSVRDPDRLADRLGVPQRTALRAMLDALLDDPASGFVSARIELRSPVEGTIAVALRILTTLAEGRRVTFLEPYYVSLQSTVTGIRWRNGSSIALDFTTAPDPRSPKPPLAQRQAQLPE
ncbi:hypothetical protein [Microcella indica]|uniref:hypothetical protein n=1 Tax=Microcella indica TaxID=2750620 RepID=UPI0015CF0077|nr:hypothetical protein [Microcella indica]